MRDGRRGAARTATELEALAVPTVAWFAVGAAVRPAITRAIVVGDCARRALVAHSDGHPTFVGRMEEKPRTGHGHAFFLPADDDGDGRLDRIVIGATQRRRLARVRMVDVDRSPDFPELSVGLAKE